ncbi:hypothetical protein B484DRAFT_356470 [Ochromonadaceae sp. CCMP2298]|nr:hypothetical protein B484DRAFT_356470 [Ochromonadaceae sp. CCMP2298]
MTRREAGKGRKAVPAKAVDAKAELHGVQGMQGGGKQGKRKYVKVAGTVDVQGVQGQGGVRDTQGGTQGGIRTLDIPVERPISRDCARCLAASSCLFLLPGLYAFLLGTELLMYPDPSICVYMCLYVSICVYMCLYVSICVYMCLYVSI